MKYINPQISVFTLCNVNVTLLKAKFAKIRVKKKTHTKPHSVLLISNTSLMKRHRIKSKMTEKDIIHTLIKRNLVLTSDKEDLKWNEK